jgi:glycosyltransferase involved in cell wall biosynthesis
MSIPFYSIIIPTLNSDKTLKRCLESIVSQTFKDLEIILIDGVSTDLTIEIIEEYSSVYSNICWVSEKDTGVYDAMNKGVNSAKGQWLYFLGSDDQLFDPQVLGDVFQQLTGMPDCEMFYGNAYFVKSKIVWHGKFTLNRLLIERNICHQAIFYKASLFEKLGHFNLSYKICADWDYNIRCFMHTDILIKYFDRIISNYEDGSGVSLENDDPDFFKLIPMRYIHRLEALNTEVNLIKQSKEFKLGSLLLKPLKFLKSLG